MKTRDFNERVSPCLWFAAWASSSSKTLTTNMMTEGRKFRRRIPTVLYTLIRELFKLGIQDRSGRENSAFSVRKMAITV